MVSALLDMRAGSRPKWAVDIPTSNETKMETFIQPKITGYRQLNEAEAALMNQAKELAKQCGDFVASLRALDVDQRWVSIGATDLQTGFMGLVRSIAQPTTF